MDAIAIELPPGIEAGAPVTLVGDGVLVEQHARVSGTIGYEIACGLVTRPPRAQREVIDA
jgi:alanine racemase